MTAGIYIDPHLQQFQTELSSIISIRTFTRMSLTTNSAGSHATFTKPYDRKSDGKDRAFDTLNIMSEMAASRSLSDYVKLDPAPALLAEPIAVDAGATAATRAQFEIDSKKYEKQFENFNDLILDFKKLINTESFAHMLQITGTKRYTTLSPREIYSKFKKAYCSLTGSELTEAQLELQRVWELNTDLTDFISMHSGARERIELSTEATPQGNQVLALEIALRNLFDSKVKFASKAPIRAEHLPFAAGPDSFTEYVRILLEHVISGEFNDVQKPIAKVNAIKEQSAGGARSRARGPPPTPAEKSARNAANKIRFASCSLDANCPVHTHPNKLGQFHKWRECDVYTSKGADGK